MKSESVTHRLEPVPEDVRQVMKRLFDTGFHVWLVGGGIRDLHLGLAPQDWDLATTASPQQIAELFPSVIPVGVQHGTVIVRHRRRSIEVTTCPGTHAGSIMDDLARRDFTINALALSYPDGELLDPHAGLADLGAGCIRAVGDARARFREDPLRTLRAARFVSTLGFRIAATTFEALADAAPDLAGVAMERVGEEMKKIVVGSHIVAAFDLMHRSGVLSVLLPELAAPLSAPEDVRRRSDDLYRHSIGTARHAPPQVHVRLAALLHDIEPWPQEPFSGEAAEGEPAADARFEAADGRGPEFSAAATARDLEARAAAATEQEAEASTATVAAVMERWRMARRDVDRVASLVAHMPLLCEVGPTNAELRRCLARAGVDLLTDLLDLIRSHCLASPKPEDCLGRHARLRDRITRELDHSPPLELKQLAVSGRDVMDALELRPGPRVGAVLRALHEKVLDHPEWNERGILLKILEDDPALGDRPG